MSNESIQTEVTSNVGLIKVSTMARALEILQADLALAHPESVIPNGSCRLVEINSGVYLEVAAQFRPVVRAL